MLDCSATGAPSGSTYDYVWTARGSTVVPGKLSSTTIAKPTFEVPPSVDSDETYRIQADRLCGGRAGRRCERYRDGEEQAPDNGHLPRPSLRAV